MRQATREMAWEAYARDRRAKQALYMGLVRELGRQFDLLAVRADHGAGTVELTGAVLEDGDDEGESIKELRKGGSVVAWMSFDDGLEGLGLVREGQR